MSWGLQIGASLADVVVVIMRPSALEPFKQPEALDMHLGPESGFAVGPVGRAAGVSHGVDVFDAAPPPLPTLDQLNDELQAGDVGPAVARGKQLEADAKVRFARPAYTYSHSKGLFVGVSLDGSVLKVVVLTWTHT